MHVFSCKPDAAAYGQSFSISSNKPLCFTAHGTIFTIAIFEYITNVATQAINTVIKYKHCRKSTNVLSLAHTHTRQIEAKQISMESEKYKESVKNYLTMKLER